MYTGSNQFLSMHHERSQPHSMTETIDLSVDMEPCSVQTPTHGNSKLLKKQLEPI